VAQLGIGLSSQPQMQQNRRAQLALRSR